MSAPRLGTAVGCRIVGDRPSGVIAAADDCRKEAAVLILTNDLNLLLIAREVSDGKGLTWRDSSLAQLITAPIININVRQIDVANLFVGIIHNTNRG